MSVKLNTWITKFVVTNKLYIEFKKDRNVMFNFLKVEMIENVVDNSFSRDTGLVDYNLL